MKISYTNGTIKRKRAKLVEQFGGCCAHCKKCNGDFINEEESDKKIYLEFAHQIGFRFPKGKSRGYATRVYEIERFQERFLLLCKECHVKYDQENPLTPEERVEAEVPF